MTLPTSATPAPSTQETATSFVPPTTLEGKRDLLAKALLKVLSGMPTPLADLEKLRPQVEELTSHILGTKVAPTKAARFGKAGTVTLAGTLTYWLALAAGIISPPVGVFLGLLGSAGLTLGYKLICETRRDFEFLRAFYSCLLLVQQADRIVTDLERKQMAGFIESLPIAESDRNELREIKVEKLEDLKIPGWFEASHARTILTGCWSLSYCDGIAEEETELFKRLAEKFGVKPHELLQIREEAIDQVQFLEDNILRIGLIASTLWPQAREHRAKITEILSFLSVRNATGEDIARDLSDLENDPVGQAALLGVEGPEETVLASSLVLCLDLTEGETWKKAGEVFIEEARKLQRDVPARGFLQLVETAFSRLSQA